MDTVPGWPQRRLEAPARRGAPYYLRPEQLPESLQQEMDAYLHRIAHPDPFLGPGGKTLAPTTINQLRLTFITLASALVASGMQVNELTSIASLVRHDNLEKALRFLYARAGHRVYHMMFRVALRARTIGAQVGLSEQDLARIDSIVASVKRAQSAEYGLTPKNRRLLTHLDDLAFVDRLLTFPHQLMQAAKTATNNRHAATRARDALAVELLLMCGMRVGNLARLRVGETIRKVGEGRDAYWVVDLPAEQVKNKQPLRFLLPAESGRLIDWYLTDWHAYWSGPGVPWLFPAKGGGHVDPPLLTISIKRRARRYVGVEITCHQFRHLSSEIFLQAHPLELGVVSQHLGHRKLDTTRTYYARKQTRVATERYHQVLARKRAEALTRPRRKRRRKRGTCAMTSPRLCLPLEDWPAIDRARWLAAQQPAGFLEDIKPASKWSADSKVITEQGYGRWLAFLQRNQALDPSSAPGDRVTVDHLREFLAELQGRVAPVSVSIAVGILLRMLRVLEPQRDWTVLARVYRQLKRTAVPSRDKLSKMVPATDLLALGIRLMHTWADVRSQQVYKAAQFRDGLIIATLICCPMRLRNLTEIVIDRHLLFDGQAYRIELTAAETKAGRLYHAAVPVELTVYIEDYLHVHRPRLQTSARADGPGTGGRLWLGRRGRPLSSAGIQH